MKVKVVQEHYNDFGVRDGGERAKKVGRTYVIEDEVYAQTLIDAGLVEQAGSKKEA